MSNVATGSTSVSLLTADEVKELDSEQLNDYLKMRLKGTKNINKHADTITVDQEVNGSNFLDLTRDDLLAIKIPLGPAKDIEKLIKEIKGEQPGAEQESLKRHIEKVVKEEVSELRREVKKVRYFAEAWLSSPGIDTETEKGQWVITHGTVMDFPLQLTAIRRRNSHGKFQNPPNLAPGAKPSEEELQEYFMDECTALKALPEIQLYVGDTHSTPLLNTRKPDFVFVQKGKPLDPLNVVAVGEIRKRTSNNFKNADIGHAVAFGEKVLQLQPRRQHVYAVLTDCIIIRIYRITREDNNRFSYRYTASESLTYNSEPPNGWKYLVTIMQNSPNQLGWIEPSINLDENTVTLVRSISSGRTSIVYEGILENGSSVVVKKAKNEEYLSCFINEKNVLTRLSDLNSPYLPKLLLSNDDTLVMTPLCTKVNNLQIKDIENIIEILRTVHSNFQLVHMDLRKYNFLRDDDGNILVTDWGYSKTQGENAPFAGALECMPDNVLQSLINDEQINYDPTIDLICLVRSLYLMLHQPSSIERISFDMVTENFKRRVQDILNFWAINGKSEWWSIISSDAENLNYDKLLEDIKKLF